MWDLIVSVPDHLYYFGTLQFQTIVSPRLIIYNAAKQCDKFCNIDMVATFSCSVTAVQRWRINTVTVTLKL